METKELILALSSAIGISGDEQQAAAVAVQELSALGETRFDRLGNLICTVCPPKEGEHHYLLDAHMDEIGFLVSYVTKEGFLKLSNCGGMDRCLLPASQVWVHTQHGPIPGVVCSIPPHLQKPGEEKKVPKMEEFYVDIGYNGKQAKELVSLGDPVTLWSRAGELQGGFLTGKALDDRAGCAAVIQAAKLLREENPACGVTVVLSTREEVGIVGAKTAAYGIAPTHAVAVDVSFGLTPGCQKEKCGEMGKGPMIGFAPVLSRAMSRELVDTAKAHGIPYQVEVMGATTGTNADGILSSGNGVCTALVSIPLGYMHTPVEKVLPADVEHTARLLAAYLVGKEGKRCASC